MMCMEGKSVEMAGGSRSTEKDKIGLGKKRQGKELEEKEKIGLTEERKYRSKGRRKIKGKKEMIRRQGVA